MTSFRPERTVLFVHGATYPAHTAFDLKLGGIVVDGVHRVARLRRLSRSTCAATASRPGRRRWPTSREANPPIVRGETAVKDIGTVVDFILARRSIPRVNLLGWSWGTVD